MPPIKTDVPVHQPKWAFRVVAAALLTAVSVLLFSLNNEVLQSSGEVMSPVLLTWVMHITFVVFLPFEVLRIYRWARAVERPSARESFITAYHILTTSLLYFLTNATFIVALRFTSASMVTAISQMKPAVIVTASVVVFRRKIKTHEVAGALTVVVGVFVFTLVTSPLEAGHPLSLVIGVFLSILSLVLGAAYQMSYKVYLGSFPVPSYLFYVAIVHLVVLWPVALASGLMQPIVWCTHSLMGLAVATAISFVVNCLLVVTINVFSPLVCSAGQSLNTPTSFIFDLFLGRVALAESGQYVLAGGAVVSIVLGFVASVV